jgi:hypothetical protein
VEPAAPRQERDAPTGTVAGDAPCLDEIVGVGLTAAACAHGLALALPEEVVMARPTGVGRAMATYAMPIESRDGVAGRALQAMAGRSCPPIGLRLAGPPVAAGLDLATGPTLTSDPSEAATIK